MLHNQLPGPFSEAANRATGRIREGGLERLSEELSCGLDLWGLPEFFYLRREAHAGFGILVAAGAATTFASCAVISPAALDLLVCVDLVTAIPPAVSVPVRLALETESAIVAALGTATVGSLKDTRWVKPGIASSPQAIIRHGTTAVTLGSTFWRAGITANLNLDIPSVRGVVLSPGFGLVVQTTDDAAALEVSIQWRERRAFSGELV